MARQRRKGLSLAFVIMTILLVEVLVGSVAATTIYYSLKSLVIPVDENSKNNGRLLIKSIKSASRVALKNKQRSVSKHYYKLAKGGENNNVYEIILMDTQGRLVAHSEVAKLATSYISPEYNKPAFHRAFQLAQGSVEVTGYNRGKRQGIPFLLPMFESQIRNILSPSLKFSTWLRVHVKAKKKKKKKKVLKEYGLHLIMDRTPVRKAVQDFTYNSAFLFFGALAFGLLFAIIIVLILNSGLRGMRTPSRAVIFENKEMAKTLEVEEARPESVIQPVPTGKQVKLLPQSKEKFYKDRLAKEPEQKIQDAIFLDNDA